MLKVLGFQLLELLESASPFNVLLSTVNLHPYTAELQVEENKVGDAAS